jgi:hypothetical protein
MSGRVSTGAEVNLLFNSWKHFSHDSVQLNFFSFLSNSVMGWAILENPSINLQ